MVKSRNRDASTFLYPGESRELGATNPSRPEGPPPGEQPDDATLQYALVWNHCAAACERALWGSSTLGTIPGMMLGRSLLSPSRLSSLPLVMLNGAPLFIFKVAARDQPFRAVRVNRL